jgi:hypothetical protein
MKLSRLFLLTVLVIGLGIARLTTSLMAGPVKSTKKHEYCQTCGGEVVVEEIQDQDPDFNRGSTKCNEDGDCTRGKKCSSFGYCELSH